MVTNSTTPPWCYSSTQVVKSLSFQFTLPPSCEGVIRCRLHSMVTPEPGASFAAYLFFLPLLVLLLSWLPRKWRCDDLLNGLTHDVQFVVDATMVVQYACTSIAALSLGVYHQTLKLGWYFIGTVSVEMVHYVVLFSVYSNVWLMTTSRVSRGRQLLWLTLMGFMIVLVCVDFLMSLSSASVADTSIIGVIQLSITILCTLWWQYTAFGLHGLDKETLAVCALWLGRLWTMIDYDNDPCDAKIFRKLHQHVWTVCWAIIAIPWSLALRRASHLTRHEGHPGIPSAHRNCCGLRCVPSTSFLVIESVSDRQLSPRGSSQTLTTFLPSATDIPESPPLVLSLSTFTSSSSFEPMSVSASSTFSSLTESSASFSSFSSSSSTLSATHDNVSDTLRFYRNGSENRVRVLLLIGYVHWLGYFAVLYSLYFGTPVSATTTTMDFNVWIATFHCVFGMFISDTVTILPLLLPLLPNLGRSPRGDPFVLLCVLVVRFLLTEAWAELKKKGGTHNEDLRLVSPARIESFVLRLGFFFALLPHFLTRRILVCLRSCCF